MNVLFFILSLGVFYCFLTFAVSTLLYMYPNVLSAFIFGPFIKLVTSYNPDYFNIQATSYSINQGKICLWDFYSTSDKLVLYVHGILSDRTYISRRELCVNLFNEGYHVVSYDSNGYGDSIKYDLSEDGLVESFVDLYVYLKNKYNKQIIIWAHSLGTGIALKGVSKLNEINYIVTHVVLESPFYDFSTAFDHYPLINYLLYGKNIIKKRLEDIKLSFLNYYYINDTSSKILIFHAKNDHTISYKNSVKLSQECNDCNLILFNRGEHSNLYKNIQIYYYFNSFVQS